MSYRKQQQNIIIGNVIYYFADINLIKINIFPLSHTKKKSFILQEL